MGPRDRPHLTPRRLPPPFAATPTASQCFADDGYQLVAIPGPVVAEPVHQFERPRVTGKGGLGVPVRAGRQAYHRVLGLAIARGELGPPRWTRNC